MSGLGAKGGVWFGIGLLILGLALIFRPKPGPEWTAIIYPTGSGSVHRVVGEYTTLGDCRTASRAVLAAMNASGPGDYECGKACVWQPGMQMFVCDETLQ